MLLFPSSPLSSKQCDPFFEAEEWAAKALGLQTSLIDYEALKAGYPRSAIHKVKGLGPALLRGWMLEVSEYMSLYSELRGSGVRLITRPTQYAQAHLISNWYPKFREFTPQTIMMHGDNTDELQEALCNLESKSAVIKDYVKSMKTYWDTAMFIPDTSDYDFAEAVCNRFLELRGPDLTVGIVLRAYKELTGNEVRTWWVNKQFKMITDHPDNKTPLPIEVFNRVSISKYADAVDRLEADFITVDLAETVSGEWIVIEVGDGQVSDRPEDTDDKGFIRGITEGTELQVA